MSFQLLGGLAGLFVGLHHSWFTNAWFCGAAATLPGYVVGLVWQLRSGGDRKAWATTVALLGIAAVALAAVAVGSEYPRMRAEASFLHSITSLQAGSMTRIEVFDGHGDVKVATVSDPRSLSEFTRGLGDSVGHSPNHPGYSHTWYVVVYGTARLELLLHLEPRFPRSVVGRQVAKSGRSMSLHGCFRSEGLRPWVEHTLLGKAGDP